MLILFGVWVRQCAECVAARIVDMSIRLRLGLGRFVERLDFVGFVGRQNGEFVLNGFGFGFECGTQNFQFGFRSNWRRSAGKHDDWIGWIGSMILLRAHFRFITAFITVPTRMPVLATLPAGLIQ